MVVMIDCIITIIKTTSSNLEPHSVLVQVIIAVSGGVFGILVIFFSMRNYRKQKQIDAMSGFYINLLVYMERLQMLLEEYPGVKRLFFDKKTCSELTNELGGESAEQYTDALRPIFSAFCEEFIGYISTADNNVSPATVYAPGKWEIWYKNIMTLTKFLHDGKMTASFHKYTSKDQYNDFKIYYAEAQTAITSLQESIKTRLRITPLPNSRIH
jgi:hypothetical protein